MGAKKNDDEEEEDEVEMHLIIVGEIESGVLLMCPIYRLRYLITSLC